MDPRVTAGQRYSVEIERPGMLHAAFVRSNHPHARVLSVDPSGAPPECVVLTPADVADLRRYGCQVKDQHVLADVARHVGDVVAAVAAPTREAAREAADRIEVVVDELPAVFDPLSAVAPGAPLIHPEAAASARDAVSIDVRPIPGSNVCHRFRIRHGDVAKGFAEADVIVEEVFRTAAAQHAPMEPHAALAEWGDGRLTIWSGTQTPFNTRADLAGMFGMPEENIRIVAPPMGGSFGAKTFVRLEAVVAALARKAGRPVRCSTARRSSSRSTAIRRSCGCGSAPGATARWSPRRSTAGPTPARTPTAGRAWRPRWATPASARTGSRTCEWTRWPSTPTCRRTALSGATARCSRCGRRSARWTCSPPSWR
jgi:CO/xanthine dehydrogenase Mo-binding subunit